jgi:hypothetical protein
MDSTMKYPLSFALSLALSTLCACGSDGPKGETLGRFGRDIEGFTSKTIDHDVYAEASYEPNYRAVFGYELLNKRNIIPVNLRVRLAPSFDGDDNIILTTEEMNLRLYLPDGTALAHVSAEDVANMVNRDDAAAKIRQLAFEGGLLNDNDYKQGYVYFSLQPENDFRIDRNRVDHGRNGVVRQLDLAGSLLAFNLTVDDKSRPFFVGTAN